MRPTLLLSAALALTTLAGCTWVKMAPGADQVRVARASEDLSACTRRGEVAVSVKDRLGPLERNEIKVRDELEVLARNEAPGLGGDTVQPRAEPNDGEQRFTVYSCGGRVAGRAPVNRDQPREDGAAEVIPLED